ncbi:hypothetical protein HYH02_000706 [Chlamydomonas schloesseri]|uniref:Uncharacterized protein n=1 Tax=Chlamydomonas schloesseri TaxID=2026947 RepID=A0A835WZ10_9CHLO|nr:hypothetical protein HYH02_000706 [Chlamydomonas schloesseri]|eukprot:KAG2454875.1 hypothetical protein HYH02_000706 [Chlamydomonas schloesseri]
MDLTPHLASLPGIPPQACVFNPAIVHVTGSLYVLFTRVYVAKDPAKRCVLGQLDKPPFMDAWNGTLANMLAVVRLKRRSVPAGPTPLVRAPMGIKVIGYRYLNETNLEDGRLFKDKAGRVMLYLSLPFGKYGGLRSSINLVYRVFLNCTLTSRPVHCDPSMGPARLLYYTGSRAWDKNWVPWNGTSMMSYVRYGPFGPHSTIDWISYTEPRPRNRFATVASETFFSRFNHTFGHLVHLSGGTPAVLEPGGESYLAVGHVRAHPACLHPHAIPGLLELLGPKVRANCLHMLKLPAETKEAIPFHTFNYVSSDGREYKHYHVDYSFFFYRFSSSPPYPITHISHGVLPPSEGHFGIVFPNGLERMGSDWLIGYGDADQAAKLMLLSAADVEKLLVPLPMMERLIKEYSVCTIQLQGQDDRVRQEL